VARRFLNPQPRSARLDFDEAGGIRSKQCIDQAAQAVVASGPIVSKKCHEPTDWLSIRKLIGLSSGMGFSPEGFLNRLETSFEVAAGPVDFTSQFFRNSPTPRESFQPIGAHS
jgi:hypothetical protein